MKNVWFIAYKDVRYLLRERSVILWVFIMPILFFYFIGTLTSTPVGSVAQTTTLVVDVPDGAGFLADEVQQRLTEGGFALVPMDSVGTANVPPIRLQFPAAFTDSVLAQKGATLHLRYAEPSPSEPLDLLRVQRAVYTVLADLAASLSAGREPNAATFAALDAMPRPLGLRVEAATRSQYIPSGFEHAIPGLIVMFVLFVLVTSGSTLLVVERNRGMLRRLASTPITRMQIVLGKWGGKMVLGVLQIAVGLLIGTVLYQMNWGPRWPMVVVILLAWGCCCASIGLFVGNVSRTEGHVTALGWLVTMSLAALGGCWWPIEVTPPWMQAIQKALPSGWAMDAMHKLISFQLPAASAVPHLLALVVVSAVLLWLTAHRFRFE